MFGVLNASKSTTKHVTSKKLCVANVTHINWHCREISNFKKGEWIYFQRYVWHNPIHGVLSPKKGHYSNYSGHFVQTYNMQIWKYKTNFVQYYYVICFLRCKHKICIIPNHRFRNRLLLVYLLDFFLAAGGALTKIMSAGGDLMKLALVRLPPF